MELIWLALGVLLARWALIGLFFVTAIVMHVVDEWIK